MSVELILCNKPCKQYLHSKYLSFQMRVIEQSRAEGVKGRLSVKVSRDQLMSWVENFVDDFNDKETTGVTNIILSCLTKVA